MSDDFTLPPEEPSAAARAAETVRVAAQQVGRATRIARQPGMPLDVLSSAVREAPLASLAVAFMLGVAVTRRR